jgi:1,4-alpha-glucan branching enzyme
MPPTSEQSSIPVQPISDRFPALEEQEVEVSFFTSTGQSVEIAGSFNDWRPQTNPLANLGAGQWVTRLVLKSGQYEYRFVVDGVWTDDPQATERVANPHGGYNAILRVGLDDRIELL